LRQARLRQTQTLASNRDVFSKVLLLVLLEWGSLSWPSVRKPIKKKEEEGIAPMAIGLSDFFFLRAHVMCLRAFSLLRALLAPWSLV
jgi:hypothetical protein